MKVSDEVIKVLDALAEKFGMAIDWTSSNIIPYIEQLCGRYIDYEIATSVVWIMLAIVLCIPCFILFRLLNKNKDFGVERYHTLSDDYFGRFLAYAGVAALCVAIIVVIMAQIIDIVTCLTFPEKIIIDELKYLIN